MADTEDPHDDLYEGEEPGEDEDDELHDDDDKDALTAEEAALARGQRIALFFDGVNDDELEAVIEGVISESESRGLFFSWAARADMRPDEVVEGSPLHQALTGTAPRN